MACDVRLIMFFRRRGLTGLLALALASVAIVYLMYFYSKVAKTPRNHHRTLAVFDSLETIPGQRQLNGQMQGEKTAGVIEPLRI